MAIFGCFSPPSRKFHFFVSLNSKSLTDYEYVVVQSAIASRIVLLTLIILWRSLLTSYDTSAPINPRCLSTTTSNYNVLFPNAASAIESSVVWDSVYFVRIAQCGYEYEQTYAFLPLLPLCISLLSRSVFAPLIPLVGHRAVMALSGYVLNNIAFVFAALYLCRLSVIVLKNREAAVRATILFCFNPASIFYSSIYSESLYALLSFGGAYHLMSGANNFAILWLALSGFARSNGVLNAGYIGFQTMHRAYEAIFRKKHTIVAFQVLMAGALRCVCVFVPFIAFQAYGYYNMCLGHFPNKSRPWCNARLPLLYNYIQSYYWDVGFLRYFRLKQLPNFFLAFPILSVALCSIIHYVKLFPDVLCSLGFRLPLVDDKTAAVLFSLGADTKSTRECFSDTETSEIRHEDHTLKRRRRTINNESDIKLSSESSSEDKLANTSIILLPFVLHLAFMTATAFFVMHVQVSTRFLSANPLIYWFAAYLMVSPRIGKIWGYLIWGYSAAYILLGTLLFSNFYPFT